MSRSVRTVTIVAVTFVLAAVLWPSGAHAQRHAVPRPPGSGHVVYRPYYAYPPYYYNHFYWGCGWGYGWHPWFYYPYAYPPYYGGYYYDDSSSLRLQVKPNNAAGRPPEESNPSRRNPLHPKSWCHRTRRPFRRCSFSACVDPK